MDSQPLSQQLKQFKNSAHSVEVSWVWLPLPDNQEALDFPQWCQLRKLGLDVKPLW